MTSAKPFDFPTSPFEDVYPLEVKFEIPPVRLPRSESPFIAPQGEECPLKSESLSADRFVFSCPACKRLIDHPQMAAFTSFDVFGIPRSFDVDTKGLKREFKALQGFQHNFGQILFSTAVGRWSFQLGSLNFNFRQTVRPKQTQQTVLHPDKFAGADDAEQAELAESWSSLVNDSYNRLLKPLERAQYLLELSGQPLAEGEIQVST